MGRARRSRGQRVLRPQSTRLKSIRRQNPNVPKNGRCKRPELRFKDGQCVLSCCRRSLAGMRQAQNDAPERSSVWTRPERRTARMAPPWGRRTCVQVSVTERPVSLSGGRALTGRRRSWPVEWDRPSFWTAGPAQRCRPRVPLDPGQRGRHRAGAVRSCGHLRREANCCRCTAKGRTLLSWPSSGVIVCS
jgi:hypothetical protein